MKRFLASSCQLANTSC